MDEDYYEVLGVGRNATDDQLRKAYRKAALKCHPVSPATEVEAIRT